jgi:hypothetical protein
MHLFDGSLGRSEVVLVWKMREITCRTMIDPIWSISEFFSHGRKF